MLQKLKSILIECAVDSPLNVDIPENILLRAG